MRLAMTQNGIPNPGRSYSLANDVNLACLNILVKRYGADVILRGNSPHLHCCPYHGVCLLGRDLPCRLGSVVSRLPLSPYLVPGGGIEPPIDAYKATVMPFN